MDTLEAAIIDYTQRFHHLPDLPTTGLRWRPSAAEPGDPDRRDYYILSGNDRSEWYEIMGETLVYLGPLSGTRREDTICGPGLD